MAAEPQIVRIVLEDPAGGRQPPPGRTTPFSGPFAPPASSPVNRLHPPPNPGAGPVPGSSAPPVTAPPPAPTPTPPPNPVLAGMGAQADKVAESNKALAEAMADPAYLSATLRLAAAQEQQRDLVRMQQELAEKAREALKYGPGGKPLGTDTTDAAKNQADKLTKASEELAGALADPAYWANLERLAAAQERHAELTREQNRLAEAAHNLAKHGPGGKPADPNPVLTGMGAQADKLAESNRQLAEAMRDPAYAAGQKRLLDLEKERVRLAKEGQRIADDARYGKGGGAGRAAGQQVAEAGGGRFTQIAAGAATGGMAGATAAAGGPLALAAALKDAVDKVKQMPADLMRAGGSAAARLADPRGQGLGTIAGAADKAATALEKIPLVGDTLGPPAKLLAATFGAVNDVAEAFVQRGRELAAYNGDLASSGARQDTARLLADMREADEMGAGLAKMTDGMTDLETLVREGLLPIKTFLVEVLGDAIKELLNAARVVLTFIRDAEGLLKKIIPDSVREYAARILKAIEGNQDPIDLMQDWLNAADGLGPMPTIPSGAASDPGMGLPVFTR
ncbi:MAG TPA: hypothetical protein VD866_04030 [Urbifossiella sp.]|nr:hypothetical protein [Urbifossiella sp.]